MNLRPGCGFIPLCCLLALAACSSAKRAPDRDAAEAGDDDAGGGLPPLVRPDASAARDVSLVVPADARAAADAAPDRAPAAPDAMDAAAPDDAPAGPGEPLDGAPDAEADTGPPMGLRGEYFAAMDFTDIRLVRVDPTIDFDWALGPPDKRLPSDHFSVRWTGTVTAPTAELYTFYTYSDDGMRVIIDGKTVVDDFSSHNQREKSGTFAMLAGQAYEIRVEYFESTTTASAHLLWSSATHAKEPVPPSALAPPAQ